MVNKKKSIWHKNRAMSMWERETTSKKKKISIITEFESEKKKMLNQIFILIYKQQCELSGDGLIVLV